MKLTRELSDDLNNNKLNNTSIVNEVNEKLIGKTLQSPITPLREKNPFGK